ncbi:MAG: dihydrodipicolinate synthase family protein [Candidatus Puniceispirillaceae bacterium]
MDFYGIYTPVITPHHDDFSIDEQGFAAVIEHLISDGVHGIIIAGTTGEYYAQTMSERERMLALGTEIINKRVAVIGGTGALRTEDSIHLAKTAKAAGVDGILVATPPYSVPTGRENALHALAVERSVDLPVMLYNYPGRMAAEMDEEFLDRVGQSPNFKAIKESSGDINRVHMLARRYPHIGLSCGMDDQALEFFAWGARSWVCAASNFAAKAHIALWQSCVVEGDFAKGRRIMSAMLPLMQVLEQGGKFIQAVKYGVARSGLPAGIPRLPLKPLNKDEKRDLDQVIDRMNATIDTILSEGQK